MPTKVKKLKPKAADAEAAKGGKSPEEASVAILALDQSPSGDVDQSRRGGREEMGGSGGEPPARKGIPAAVAAGAHQRKPPSSAWTKWRKANARPAAKVTPDRDNAPTTRQLPYAGFEQLLTYAKRHDGQWAERFEQLQAYKAEHGNCNVPKKYDMNPPLGNWVMAQRTRHKKGELLEERKSCLDEIGFHWRLRNHQRRPRKQGKLAPVVHRHSEPGEASPEGDETKLELLVSLATSALGSTEQYEALQMATVAEERRRKTALEKERRARETLERLDRIHS